MKLFIRKACFAFAILCFFTTVIFMSCQKEESKSACVSQVKWEIMDKEHLNIINDVSNNYEQAIVEAIDERNSNLKSSNNNCISIVDLINKKFTEKCEKYSNNVILKSSGDQIISIDLIESYVSELSDKLLNIDEFNDTINLYTKDLILSKFYAVFDDFNNSIMNDELLSEAQKQILIENIVLRFNIFYATLEHGEQIRDQAQLKSIGSWIKDHKKEIECTAKSMLAGAACTSAIISTATGPAAIALWVVCTAKTMQATICWVEYADM